MPAAFANPPFSRSGTGHWPEGAVLDAVGATNDVHRDWMTLPDVFTTNDNHRQVTILCALRYGASARTLLFNLREFFEAGTSTGMMESRSGCGTRVPHPLVRYSPPCGGKWSSILLTDFSSFFSFFSGLSESESCATPRQTNCLLCAS